jgi:hypothetical protein
MITSQRIQIAVNYRVIHGIVRRIIARLLEWRAWCRGNVFHCAALSGDSGYNTSINANLTVSCNCQDRDGAGVIGSLKTHTFDEIWFGEQANALRQSLANGKLPMTWCADCCDRKEVKRG